MPPRPTWKVRVVVGNILMSHMDMATHVTCDIPAGRSTACVSTLAIDVIPEVDLVAAEMRRVTRPGGVVACGTFDFWGGNSVLDLVLDTGAVLDESIRTCVRRSKPGASGGCADRAQLRLRQFRGLLVELLGTLSVAAIA